MAAEDFPVIFSMPDSATTYACRPCEVYWVNAPKCFICNDTGTVISEAVVRKEPRISQ